MEVELANELGEAVERKKLSPLQAPLLSASSFKLIGTGTDFVLILERVVPMYGADGQIDEIAMLQPTAAVTLSPGAAKDLGLLLTNHVAKYEEKFGPVNTPYVQNLAAK